MHLTLSQYVSRELLGITLQRGRKTGCIPSRFDRDMRDWPALFCRLWETGSTRGIVVPFTRVGMGEDDPGPERLNGHTAKAGSVDNRNKWRITIWLEMSDEYELGRGTFI